MINYLPDVFDLLENCSQNNFLYKMLVQLLLVLQHAGQPTHSTPGDQPQNNIKFHFRFYDELF